MGDRQHAGPSWPSAGHVAIKLFLICLAASTTLPSTTASRFHSWLGGANQIPFVSFPLPLNDRAPSSSKLPSREHDFQLRHIFHHGTHQYPNVHMRMDVESGVPLHTFDDDGKEQTLPSTFRIRSRDTMIERLSDRGVSTMRSMYHNARLRGIPASFDESKWTMDEVAGPNTADKETVMNLAKMSWCAYVKEPGTGEWQDIGGGFNESQGLGWEGDSLRGHIFADKDNSTIIVALKGTSPGKPSLDFSTYNRRLPQTVCLDWFGVGAGQYVLLINIGH